MLLRHVLLTRVETLGGQDANSKAEWANRPAGKGKAALDLADAENFSNLQTCPKEDSAKSIYGDCGRGPIDWFYEYFRGYRMYLADVSVHSPKSPGTSHLIPIVFVIDDDTSACASLGEAICGEGWRLVPCASAQEFQFGSQVPVPCCMILNVALPGINGLELLRQVAIRRNDMPVISIADQSDILLAVQAMKAGAVEFFTKPYDGQAMVAALRDAITSSKAAQQQRNAIRALRERFESLSRREHEVMSLIVKGLMNKQVGGVLGISEITVKAHRGRVMQKMRATSFADLVTMAAELGIRMQHAA
jgi:FixJ family two-component response regulator